MREINVCCKRREIATDKFGRLVSLLLPRGFSKRVNWFTYRTKSHQFFSYFMETFLISLLTFKNDYPVYSNLWQFLWRKSIVHIMFHQKSHLFIIFFLSRFKKYPRDVNSLSESSPLSWPLIPESPAKAKSSNQNSLRLSLRSDWPVLAWYQDFSLPHNLSFLSLFSPCDPQL